MKTILVLSTALLVGLVKSSTAGKIDLSVVEAHNDGRMYKTNLMGPAIKLSSSAGTSSAGESSSAAGLSSAGGSSLSSSMESSSSSSGSLGGGQATFHTEVEPYDLHHNTRHVKEGHKSGRMCNKGLQHTNSAENRQLSLALSESTKAFSSFVSKQQSQISSMVEKKDWTSFSNWLQSSVLRDDFPAKCKARHVPSVTAGSSHASGSKTGSSSTVHVGSSHSSSSSSTDNKHSNQNDNKGSTTVKVNKPAVNIPKGGSTISGSSSNSHATHGNSDSIKVSHTDSTKHGSASSSSVKNGVKHNSNSNTNSSATHGASINVGSSTKTDNSKSSHHSGSSSTNSGVKVGVNTGSGSNTHSSTSTNSNSSGVKIGVTTGSIGNSGSTTHSSTSTSSGSSGVKTGVSTGSIANSGSTTHSSTSTNSGSSGVKTGVSTGSIGNSGSTTHSSSSSTSSSSSSQSSSETKVTNTTVTVEHAVESSGISDNEFKSAVEMNRKSDTASEGWWYLIVKQATSGKSEGEQEKITQRVNDIVHQNEAEIRKYASTSEWSKVASILENESKSKGVDINWAQVFGAETSSAWRTLIKSWSTMSKSEAKAQDENKWKTTKVNILVSPSERQEKRRTQSLVLIFEGDDADVERLQKLAAEGKTSELQSILQAKSKKQGIENVDWKSAFVNSASASKWLKTIEEASKKRQELNSSGSGASSFDFKSFVTRALSTATSSSRTSSNGFSWMNSSNGGVLSDVTSGLQGVAGSLFGRLGSVFGNRGSSMSSESSSSGTFSGSTSSRGSATGLLGGSTHSETPKGSLRITASAA